jgi:hypothetical protein
MARSVPPPSAAGTACLGAVGGAFAGAAALAVLLGGTAVLGRPPLEAANAVGAWPVRWLQTAAPSSLGQLFLDATLGGPLLAWLVAILAGALVAVALDRLPEGEPLSWGVLIGLGLAALVRWVLAPALDPLLVRTVPTVVILAAGGVFGAVMGGWLAAARRSRVPDSA